MVDEMVGVMEGDNRPPVYYEGGKLIIRASAIGGTCLFDLVAAGQGHEPSRLPEKLERAFQQGHELEPVVVEMLERDNYVFVSKQVEGDWEVVPGIVIRYHPDGIAAKGLDGACVVEIKALSDVLWQKFFRGGMATTIKEYEWQLSVMMIDTGLPGLWAGYNKGNTDGTSCKDKGRLHLEWLRRPPITREQIIEKAIKIKELVDGEDILTSGQECGDPNHWPCRFLHLRQEPEDGLRAPNEVSVDLSDSDKQQIDELVKQYTYHKGHEDEHRSRREYIRGEIIRLGGGERGRLVTDKWVVPIYEGSGAKSYDWGAMPDELKVELAKYEKPGKKYLYISRVQRRD